MTETIPIHEADGALRARLIKQGLIKPSSQTENLIDIAREKLCSLRERYLYEAEDRISYLEEALRIIYGIHIDNVVKIKIDYSIHLILKKISNLENSLAKDFNLKSKFREFSILRSGFFFAFKENKKNTP